MIHVVTVHWEDPRWIPIQRRFLDRYMEEPYRLWAFLGKLPENAAADRAAFHYANTLPIRPHSWKLNLLGDMACAESHERPSDILVFIDGDAFPLAPLAPFIRAQLERAPLIAVQRQENVGDRQPHPSFCATTVGFWRAIGGDWQKGATWADSRGNQVTDVGGNLLRALEEGGHSWTPLLRSNARDLHPLLFGIYADLIYHHGGGFRRAAGGRVFLTNTAHELRRHPLAWLFDQLPERRFRGLRRRLDPRRRAQRVAQDTVADVSQRVFDLIERDDEFQRLFLDPGYEGELAEVRLEAAPLRGARP